jgi:hypothetical protein
MAPTLTLNEDELLQKMKTIWVPITAACSAILILRGNPALSTQILSASRPAATRGQVGGGSRVVRMFETGGWRQRLLHCPPSSRQAIHSQRACQFDTPTDMTPLHVQSSTAGFGASWSRLAQQSELSTYSLRHTPSA